MSEPAQKCENNQNYAQKTLYCFKNGLFLLFWPEGKS